MGYVHLWDCFAGKEEMYAGKEEMYARDDLHLSGKEGW